MAVDPATLAKIASMLADEENRKKIFKTVGGIIVGILILVILILSIFGFLLSGLLSFVSEGVLRDNWKLIHSNITGVFEGIDRSAATSIKKEVYDFMPDFSLNLSKAAISTKYNGNSLLMYDTSDYQKARETMKNAAESIRECSSEVDFLYVCQAFNISEGFSFDEISADTTFMEDTALAHISEYGENVLSLLFDAAAHNLGSYNYEYEEYTTGGGKSATRQTLTVKEGERTQIVEYSAVGGVRIYLPKLLAYYQVRLIDDTYLNDTMQGSDIDKAIGDGLGGDFANAENEDELKESVKKAKPSKILSFLQVADMAGILGNAVKDGKIGVKTYKTVSGNTEKLTVQLEAPDVSEWLKLFNVGNEQADMVEEFQTIIEENLKSCGVEEEEFYLDLDNFFQSSLFVYFEGFFNLPVDSDRLSENGILSKYGDYSKIHRVGNSKLIESGTTLRLLNDNKDTEVKIDLLPSVGVGCFYDVIIYDVWKAENHSNMANANELFNCDSITVAYCIDLDEFEKTYGFSFPEADPDNEDNHFTKRTVTLLVEYSCITLTEYDENDRGISILEDIRKGSLIIGTAHNGESQSSDRDNREANDYRHSFDDFTEGVPHCSVKIDFIDDWVAEGLNDKGEDEYTGMSGRSYRNYNVSPLLWFKGFRTELDDDVLAGLVAAK